MPVSQIMVLETETVRCWRLTGQVHFYKVYTLLIVHSFHAPAYMSHPHKQ